MVKTGSKNPPVHNNKNDDKSHDSSRTDGKRVVKHHSNKRFHENRVLTKKILKSRDSFNKKKVVQFPGVGKVVVADRRHGGKGRKWSKLRGIGIGNGRSHKFNKNSKEYSTLLSYLLRGRSLAGSSEGEKCVPQDTYVNYVYWHDIPNQVFNDSFKDPNSDVIQEIQSKIADFAAEEICKRNMVSYIIDEVRLNKIVDASEKNDDRATIRLYVSVNVSKNNIPMIRRVLEAVFEKLQNQCFGKSSKKIDWTKMVLIPIKK